MKSALSITASVRQLIARTIATQKQTMAEGQPFYIVMSLLFVAVSLLIVADDPALRAPYRLLAFTGLMALHIAMHWLSPRFADDGLGLRFYLAGQGMLAFALVLVSNAPPLSLALFAALIGEIIGSHGLVRLVTGAVIGYIGLMIGGYFMIGGADTVADWASPTISTLILLIIFMVLYRRQMEARVQAQTLLAELEMAHTQLADYAAQVESLTLASERQRMARELHDTLAQGVAGLILQLEAANNHLENGRSQRAQTIVQQSMTRARGTLAAARAAIDDLRLERRTLPDAIQRHADRFTQATGIPCHVVLDLAPGNSISVPITDHVERMVSESLTNITRHAQANTVRLEVVQTDGRLTVDVWDDGVGFDVETAIRTGHYGLTGLRERARLVAGTFKVHSEPGKGTHLAFTLPLEVA